MYILVGLMTRNRIILNLTYIHRGRCCAVLCIKNNNNELTLGFPVLVGTFRILIIVLLCENVGA